MFARLLILCAVGTLSCDSTALSLGDPETFSLSIDHPYMDGDTYELQVEAVFEGVDDPDDQTGDLASFEVVSWDFGDELVLQEWAFRSNFRLSLTVGRFEGEATEPVGQHTLRLKVRNHYGAFVATGDFFVFR